MLAHSRRQPQAKFPLSRPDERAHQREVSRKSVGFTETAESAFAAGRDRPKAYRKPNRVTAGWAWRPDRWTP